MSLTYDIVVEVRIHASRGEPMSNDLVSFLIRKDLGYGSNLDETYFVESVKVKDVQEVKSEDLPW